MRIARAIGWVLRRAASRMPARGTSLEGSIGAIVFSESMRDSDLRSRLIRMRGGSCGAHRHSQRRTAMPLTAAELGEELAVFLSSRLRGFGARDWHGMFRRLLDDDEISVLIDDWLLKRWRYDYFRRPGWTMGRRDDRTG